MPDMRKSLPKETKEESDVSTSNHGNNIISFNGGQTHRCLGETLKNLPPLSP